MMTRKQATSPSSLTTGEPIDMEVFPYDHMQYDQNPERERISKRIDDELKEERARRREAKRKEVKVMLLGQSEAGKSCLQKQFQLYYSSLEDEKPSWRPVVYFNIIKAVRMILDEIDYELFPPLQEPTSPGGPSRSIPGTVAPVADISPTAQAEITRLRTKLLPLTVLEDVLSSELSGGVSVTGGGRTGAFVRPGWQSLVSPTRTRQVMDQPSPRMLAVSEMVAKTLAETQVFIVALWKHSAVRSLSKLRRLRLDDSAPFFLDALDRLCDPGYFPTTEDVLNVRLQSLGVTEHAFRISSGGLEYNWIMYDVGGARGQRHAWIPYFDSATAIIFLAPISAFDQYLEEDPRTNRIDDSLTLFTAICSNKLLKNAQLVLLLNKVDLLRKKLKAGVKVRKYITSYGDRVNNYEEASEYFRAHFTQVHRRKDVDSKRMLYTHFTTMLDINATQVIIQNVGEAILRRYIEQTGLT